ncbi:MAG: hypothetical protein K5739_07015 [Lachnospiraceae bacterium]|nr:hypothetical protein [Lachnospiraceae bacterium]
MQDYTKLMMKRAAELKKAIRVAERNIKNYPKGRLRISQSGNQVRYYHVLPGQDRSGTYIKRDRLDVINQLAQKDYTERFIRSARKELSRLEQCMGLLSNGDADLVYQTLGDRRKAFVEPYILPDEVYAERWKKEEFKTNTYMPETKKYETRQGEMVRSKSEAILADILFELGIPYHYEQALMLNNHMVRYPDFTLLKVKSRELIYLEHFGLLDDENYREGCLKKLDEYMNNGIYLGKNLLITYESEWCSLDIGGTRRMLKDIFGQDQ